VAAVADWRPADRQTQKIKKQAAAGAPNLALVLNPDILKTLSRHSMRPKLVVGFAAETENVQENACRKLSTKGCDWIVANDVSSERGTFGGVKNTVLLLDGNAEPEAWPPMTKSAVAERLVERIAAHFAAVATAGG
jgi:phosphopantothenoylcysteine decarboxylase/phosphopantothenate--cysteine ligase